MYSEADFQKNKSQRGQMLGRMLLCALPGLVIAVVSVFMRWEIVCDIGLILSGAVLIFLYDMKLKPVLRYGRYLKEVHSGLSRKTAGTLVRIGADPVYMDGVWFYEVILNVYENLAEEGERRFLFDCTKEKPEAFLGVDVALTSHGNYVLNVEKLEEKHAETAE